MADKDVSRAEEAKNLAKEAVEATKQGDKDEGAFLADAAKALDKGAATGVLTGKDAAKTDDA